MRDAFTHVALLTWTAFAWTLGGFKLCPRRLRLQDPLLVAATSIALGAGLTAIFLTVAAALGALKLPVVLALQIGWTVLAVAGGREFLSVLRAEEDIKQSRSIWRILLIVILASTGLATLIATLAPPSSIDATVYHLRIPREFLRTGGLVPLKDDVRMFQPLYIQMLFAAGMSLHDDVLAALIHWFLGVAAALTAGAWARRLGARSALFSVVLFAVNPLIVWESTSCFVDLGLALFTGLGLLWASRPELGNAALGVAAGCAGLAAGSKFTGCASAALIGAMAAASVWPDRRSAIRRLAVVGGVAVLIAAPWYIRNAVVIGNPFYPLANHLFGGQAMPASSWSWTYGLGRDFLHLLTSPFDLIWRGDAFDSGWATGPAYLALIPVALLARDRPRIRTTVAILIGAYWVFWFYTSPQTRFLLPLSPLAAGLAGVGLEIALVSGVWTRMASCAALLVSLGLGLGTALITARGSARVVAGLESRTEFLRRMAWDYKAFDEVNRLLGPETRLAVFGVPNVYYLKQQVTLVKNVDVSTLMREGFSHLLRIYDCTTYALPDGPEVIWHGMYQNRGARFQGGHADHQLCAQLTQLGP
jgi:hypothetical protein